MTTRNGRKAGRHKRKSRQTSSHLLEIGTLDNIRAAKQQAAELIKYHWNLYSELARQRNLIQDEITQAIIQPCISYEFKNWQRAVKYKYGLHPLSTAGSLNFIGGRFNTGTEVNNEVPFFSGLYLAENKDTALQEHLGQEPTPKNSKLTPREIALTNPSSETIVSVSGKLDKVFDLSHTGNLTPFIKLIKKFTLSKELMAQARKLNVKNGIITTAAKLLQTLLASDWRMQPVIYEVPANSQIFGYLVYSAGIEGIIYPSKFTGKRCLVIFPKNFIDTDSFITLDDDVPHSKVPTKVDASNWRISEMDVKEIIEK